MEVVWQRRAMATYDAAVEAHLREHRWTSGYVCACGYELNSPHGWALHLFAEWEARG